MSTYVAYMDALTTATEAADTTRPEAGYEPWRLYGD